MALSIAKAGYYGGSLDNIYASRVDYVVNTFFYEAYTQEYEITLHEINKKGK
jgi:hypothetical protein